VNDAVGGRLIVIIQFAEAFFGFVEF